MSRAVAWVSLFQTMARCAPSGSVCHTLPYVRIQGSLDSRAYHLISQMPSPRLSHKPLPFGISVSTELTFLRSGVIITGKGQPCTFCFSQTDSHGENRHMFSAQCPRGYEPRGGKQVDFLNSFICLWIGMLAIVRIRMSLARTSPWMLPWIAMTIVHTRQVVSISCPAQSPCW